MQKRKNRCTVRRWRTTHRLTRVLPRRLCAVRSRHGSCSRALRTNRSGLQIYFADWRGELPFDDDHEAILRLRPPMRLQSRSAEKCHRWGNFKFGPSSVPLDALFQRTGETLPVSALRGRHGGLLVLIRLGHYTQGEALGYWVTISIPRTVPLGSTVISCIGLFDPVAGRVVFGNKPANHSAPCRKSLGSRSRTCPIAHAP